MQIEHVLVVGAGQMGGGIAQVIAASGRRASLHDPYPGATDRALETMRRSLEKLADKGGADPDEAIARIAIVDDLVPADVMIEAVVEDVAAKQDVFRRADDALPADAILASNTVPRPTRGCNPPVGAALRRSVSNPWVERPRPDGFGCRRKWKGLASA